MQKKDQNNHQRNTFDYKGKIKWVPRVVETLENAQAKLLDHKSGNFAYVRAYSENIIHVVIVTKDNVLHDTTVFDHRLMTQFAEYFTEDSRRNSFEVVWEKATAPISDTASSHMESGREFSRPFRQEEYTPSLKKYKHDFTNNDQKGRKVRHSVAPQIDSEQFKKFFENSVVVDESGKPMVVYHGSSADFTVFDHKFAMRNGAAEGRGFYFTSDREKAEGFKTENGKLFEVYLSMQKPLNPDELTITRAEVEKIIRAAIKTKRAISQNGLIKHISRDGLPDPIITHTGAAGRFSALSAYNNIPPVSENANLELSDNPGGKMRKRLYSVLCNLYTETRDMIILFISIIQKVEAAE